MALTPQNQPPKTMTFGGHSEVEKVVAKAQKKKKDAKIQVLVEQEYLTAFKLACVAQGTDMSSVVTSLIDQWMRDK